MKRAAASLAIVAAAIGVAGAASLGALGLSALGLGALVPGAVPSSTLSIGDQDSAATSRVVHASARLTSAADVSSNWSGYVATGLGSTSTTASSSMAFSDVTGQWTQPTAICTPGRSTSAALWVGIGGYSQDSNELEQTGTSADCSATGKATYYAWYELVPADSVNVSLKIFPGDVITSSVVITGPGQILVQVKDRTRRTSFTKHLTMATPDLTSAEWIAEAPSECSASGFCREIPLTNFGTVNFTKTYAIGNAVKGTITSPSWMTTALQLIPEARRFFGDQGDPSSGSGGAGAAPSGLTADGSGFTLNWQANPTAPVTMTA